ncbi:MAG: hypothetical protein NG784_06755 [Candidatus Jettenia sp.]|nr:hypothetical protein [Candidatus Jettenia sp.]
MVKYADDSVNLCQSEEEAKNVLRELKNRRAVCGRSACMGSEGGVVEVSLPLIGIEILNQKTRIYHNSYKGIYTY